MASDTNLVLLISASKDDAAQLATQVQASSRKVVAAPFGPTAMGRAAQAALIVIDRVEGSTDALRAVIQLRAMPSLVHTPILCIAASDDVDERVSLLEAGADDVVARPFHPDELRARIDALLMTPVTAPEPERDETGAVRAASSRRHRLVTFFSPKGGVGVTTLAVNTAVVAARSGRSVALLDLDLEWGQVATHLNLAPKYSIVELARDTASLSDPEMVRTYAEKHSTGIAVFAAPQRPDQHEMIGQEHVSRLLDAAVAAYDQVFVDGGSTFNERTLTLIEQSDRVVLLAVPEIPAVRAVHTLLEMLGELGAPPERQFLVLNHLFQHDMLRLDDLERSVQATIQAELPYDPIAFVRAVNEGVPIVASANRGGAAAKLEQVISAVLGEHEIESAKDKKSRVHLPKLSFRAPARSRT